MSDNIFSAIVLTTIICFIGSFTFYKYSELKTMEKNIETAIAKGIDPIAVRCSYANERDVICVAYAANSPQPTPKTK